MDLEQYRSCIKGEARGPPGRIGEDRRDSIGAKSVPKAAFTCILSSYLPTVAAKRCEERGQ